MKPDIQNVSADKDFYNEPIKDEVVLEDKEKYLSISINKPSSPVEEKNTSKSTNSNWELKFY